MADFNSGLPVRTETNGDVAVKIVDGTITSQAMSVDSSGRLTAKNQDGAGNALTSQVNGAQRALDVGINVAGVQIDPRVTRALTAADVVTTQQGTSPWITKDQADGPVAPGTAAAFSELIGAQYSSVLPTLTTGQQAALQADASGRLLVGSIASALPAGANNIGSVNLSLAGVPITGLAPLPVSIAAAPTGTVVNDYNTAASLAAAATSNHTYTITTAKAFQGKKIHASASGKLKIEVQISSNGTTFNTVFVAFNSTATPNIDVDMDQILFLQAAGTGAAVRVIRTNLDKQAQDVYSTISGVEV